MEVGRFNLSKKKLSINQRNEIINNMNFNSSIKEQQENQNMLVKPTILFNNSNKKHNFESFNLSTKKLDQERKFEKNFNNPTSPNFKILNNGNHSSTIEAMKEINLFKNDKMKNEDNTKKIPMLSLLNENNFISSKINDQNYQSKISMLGNDKQSKIEKNFQINEKLRQEILYQSSTENLSQFLLLDRYDNDVVENLGLNKFNSQADYINECNKEYIFFNKPKYSFPEDLLTYINKPSNISQEGK